MTPLQITLTVLGGVLLLLAVLYILALKTNRRRRATELFTTYNYTHRGLFGGDECLNGTCKPPP